MYKLISAMLAAVIAAVALSCAKEKIFNPPADAEVISFVKNDNVKQKVIYQFESTHSFTTSESSRLYWAGIKIKPSHRLHIRLLSDSGDILFTLYFPAVNRKVYCRPMADKVLTGCEIPEQPLTEDEFIIEVLAPKGMVYKKNPEYRLFAGIQGSTPLEFYSRKK